jgi:putative membrane protein
MRLRDAWYWLLVGFYAVLWIGGVATRIVRPGQPAPVWAAPAFLLAAAAIAAAGAREPAAILLFAAGGFLLELVGVHWGLPFGRYAYTGLLGPGAGGVPFAIAFAWLSLLLFARDCAWRMAGGKLRAALLGAGMMTLVDLLVDPVATRLLGYWEWRQPGLYFGVPAINFTGWFAVSAVLLGIAGKPREVSRSVLAAGASVVLFFAVIAACR